IREPFALSGTGLHTGATCTLRVEPAESGHGVVFVRTDLPDRPRLPADIDYVDSQGRRTSIRMAGAEICTVEHFLAACHAMRVDNLLISADGPEVPGLDGSALPFVEALRAAKPVDQDKDRPEFQLLQPLSVSDPAGDSSIVALPAEQGLSFS